MRDSYSYDIKLTLWDMFVFLMKHEYSSFSGLFGLCVSIFAIAGLAFGWAGEDSNMFFVYIVIALMFTVLNPLRLFMSAAQQLSKNPTFQTAITYSFDEDGVHLRQGELANDNKWEELSKLAKGRSIMVLYVSKKIGYILPKSALGSEYDEVAQYITSHMEAAKAAEKEEGSDE
ncbi:MAG: YcxB family protein [Lachnospiraceae bacterium]|nr:YcxB family protein [Lachnospiraceae bacterium]